MTRIVACERPEHGAATIRLSTGEAFTYRCDATAHRITVTDVRGRVRFAFGEHGSRPGQLNLPMDVALVAPEFDAERLPLDFAPSLWLAVADYGNRRIQIFELDGCVVGTIDDADQAALGAPCKLTWHAPVLDVESVDGVRAGLHLAAALLYDSTRLAPASTLPRLAYRLEERH